MSQHRRQISLSQLISSTLRLVHYLPPQLADMVHWRLFRTPFLHSRTAEQQAILSQGRPFLVKSGPYLLKGYRFGGPGPTAVLTHGWQGSASSWFRLIPLLQDLGYAVVAFDGPGHSGRPRVATLPDYAQGLSDIAQLFSPVEILVGHSFGGMASARVAQDIPTLKALVLIATPDRVDTLVDGFVRRLNLVGPARERFYQRVHNASSVPLEEEATSLYLKKVSCPTLVLHDHSDDVIAPEDARRIAAAAKTEVVFSNGLGHRQIMKDPETLTRVCEFLRAHSACPYDSAILSLSPSRANC